MTREEALAAVKAHVANENLVKHMLATEAIMRALARRLGEDEAEWGLAGLLHDIDLDLVAGDMTKHSKPGSELARELGAGDRAAHAILAHNERHGVTRDTALDRALFCTDPLTGLITAAALVRPDKKLASVEVKSVLRRFKEKGFAAGANRAHISQCGELGLTLEDFVAVALAAMQGVAGELGL